MKATKFSVASVKIILTILWPILCECFVLFLHKCYMYALKACIELEERCYHTKGMFRGGTLWYVYDLMP